MDLQELTLSFLTKVYNKTEDEIKAIIYNGEEINENAFETLSSVDSARIKRIKDESKSKFDNGYSKGKLETAQEHERLLRETFGINEELPFPELLPKVKEVTSVKSKLTPDDVKKHPEYLALESTRVKKEDYDKLSADFENFKKNIDRKIKIDKVKEKALVSLETFNPDFPDVPQIKQNLINVYLSSFDSYDDFEFSDKDIIAVKEGKRVEDAHGNPIGFEKLCKDTASGFFKFKVQGEKGNSGNKNGSDASSPSGFTFTSKEDMVSAYAKIPETDVAKRKEFAQKARVV